MNLSFMESSDHRREDVRGLQIVIIIWSIKIGGHGANEIAAELFSVGLAELNPGNFSDGVPFIRGLQGA